MKPAIVKLCYAIILSTLLFSCKKDSVDVSKEGSSSSTQQTNPATKQDVDVAETAAPVQVAVSQKITDNCFGFYRALPARYDSTSKKYPLLIFLHGSGEMGNGTTDLPKVLTNAVPKLINNKTFPANFNVNGENFSFIVFSPQSKNYTTVADVYAMIQYAIKNYRIDTTRIYVTGLSLGGNFTWATAAKYPALLAAVVPICSSLFASDANGKSIANANLPVWAFHNEDDDKAPVKNTKDFINFINAYNPDPRAKMTIWSTGKHDAWTKATDPTYKENNMNMYEWMLQYHR
ncbi:MAG: prolyl oligopeptidase family serine peptidase [Agriterribacter sp.]